MDKSIIKSLKPKFIELGISEENAYDLAVIIWMAIKKNWNEGYTAGVNESNISLAVDRIIKSYIREIHNRYDKDLFELTGEKKGPHEKSHEFLKRKFNELKYGTVNA